MPDNVPSKAILRVATMACDVRYGVPPYQNWHRSRGRPPITWLHQICSDCGLSAGDALNCAQDRAVWRTYTAFSASRWRRRQRCLDTGGNCRDTVTVGVVYRPTNTDVRLFNRNYSALLSALSHHKNKCYITGDFNINLLNYESHSETAVLLNEAYSLHFYSIITRPID